MRNRNYAIRTAYLTMAIIALFITASVAIVSVAFAQGGANVYLQPLESAEGTLTVDVMADNVTDLYGAEFQLKFDPAAVTVLDAKPDQEGIQIEGGTLLPANKGFVVANKVDEAEGTVTFAMTLLNPAPSVNGSGPLARVTFNLLNANPSTIDFTKVKLVALDLQTIPSTTAPLAVSGLGEAAAQPQGQAPAQAEAQAQPESQAADSTNTAPAPAAEEASSGASGSEFPWWIVAAGVLILGVVGLAAFILMTGLASPKKNNESQSQQKNEARHTQPQQQHVAQVPQQPNRTVRTRPSAFK